MRANVLMCLLLHNPFLVRERDAKLSGVLSNARGRARIKVLLVPEENDISSRTALNGKLAYNKLTADEIWRMILLFV